MSELDYTPFNKWQMGNCAGCAMPAECEVRANNIKLLEAGVSDTLSKPCPLKVDLP